MLKLFNTFGRKLEPFGTAANKRATIFTCGPSVYQRAHIGNSRTFLFEDILVRYLEYSGYEVERGMAVTDIEDKAIKEAEKRRTSVKELTDRNISQFIKELKLLNMKVPHYMPRASDCVPESVSIIKKLIKKKIAYSHNGNIYFDPLKVPGFGKLFGLDMTKWPKKKRRFHKDTYPGIQWNYGDFILWHGCEISEKACWTTELGEGRPSWNVQDPSMVLRHFRGTLSVFCGGIDNLYRHHDYSVAILEAIKPYPMSRFWLHGAHLFVDGQKMSKSKGTIYYTDTLMKKGYSPQEIRFFLMYSHYRKKLNYSDKAIQSATQRLRDFRDGVAGIRKEAGRAQAVESEHSKSIRDFFDSNMDNDMSIKAAFDAMQNLLNKVEVSSLSAPQAAGIIRTLKKIDEVLQVIF
ncbi:MAG: class I tRNA ligase family protein [Nitrospirota bacterium]|nr:class I tRNA ligase family protein [Nitrospirota bacterium]